MGTHAVSIGMASKRSVRIIRVYCPVAAATLTALIAGDVAVTERDPTLAAMLAIVRDDNALGDFGLYRAVAELSPGWELFTPTAAARPTLGAAGSSQASATVVLNIHVDATIDDAALDPLLDRLLAAPPWEVPVIELSSAALLMRG